MSAIPQAQRGRHVRELFVKTGPNLGVGGFEAEQQESRSSYDLGGKKKRKAPPPPVGLGQYKPKILSDNNATNISANVARSGPESSTTRGPDSNFGAALNGHAASTGGKPFIIGDKDTPMVLHSPGGGGGGGSGSITDLEQGVRDLNLVSQTREVVANGGIGTANPLFDPSSPKVDPSFPNSDPPSPNVDPYVPNVDRPVSNFDLSVAKTHVERSVSNGGDVTYSNRTANGTGEPEGVFIPEPDYDEEEKTMTFQDEPDEELNADQQGKKVYKEYYGEDFSQYLSDEEGGFDETHLRQKRPNHLADRKSKTEVKRSHYKKRESLAGKGKKNVKGFSGSSSVRNFSYADSKFGTINGSSSNNNNNSNKRHSVNSLSEDKEKAELFVNSGASYEHFLRSMNGEDLGELVNDAEEESRTPQPSQVPSRYSRPSHKKDTLWKKLTWKFKKPSNGFDLNTA